MHRLQCALNGLRKAHETLSSSLTAPPSLRELSEQVGVHPVHLCREFHGYYRCTIGAMVRRLRVERACALLREGHMPPSEVALESGFSDQSHFCTVFRRTMNMTPGVYLKLSN